jgi:hypothetical protein
VKQRRKANDLSRRAHDYQGPLSRPLAEQEENHREGIQDSLSVEVVEVVQADVLTHRGPLLLAVVAVGVAQRIVGSRDLADTIAVE